MWQRRYRPGLKCGRRPAPACDDSGQGLVEIALVLPVLLLVLLGIVKFGVVLNHNEVLTNAVRAGARQLALSRGAADPCGRATSSVESAATDLDPSQLTVALQVSTAPDGATYTACSGGGVLAGHVAKVTANYPCDLEVFGIDFAPGCSLSSTMVIRIE